MGSKVLHLYRVPKGEAPPLPPKACFGRDELINQIIDLAEKFEPVALIGAGGIGKTSVALSVLHHKRIKGRFGDNRRFIRCDKFPASRAHLLRRLSEAIGAGIQNPKDLDSLRPSLSSKEMILFLDNAESLFDPKGEEFKGIYSVVEELYRFSNICLGITSRISIVPSHFKRPKIPALSVESACKIFYEIYNHHGQSNTIDDIVRELDFHALSITLLATTASHNMWDYDRLAKEWKTHRTQILRTDYDQSLAAVIDLSLNSPTFKGLGPYARDLLAVIAFFPQGVDEENLNWLFPTISERKDIIDRFCVLSLTYRSNRFVTMLAPIRDHLYPQDPKSSPLLWATKDRYFTRLSIFLDPDMPEFGEARWIASEDVNVEHLLNALIPAGQDSHEIWDVCIHFMRHLYWHKPRQTVLRSKIEGVPDHHPSKPECLFQLARLSQSVGNRLEQKQLLTRALALERERKDEPEVAQTLRYLSDVNRMLDLREEGIQQSKEALEIYERLDDKTGQTNCLNNLAWLLLSDNQLDAAKDAACRTLDLVRGGSREFVACESHRVLGDVYHSEGEREKSVEHFEEAIKIASRSSWHVQLFWIHYSLAGLYFGEKMFGDALTHIAEAKSHTNEDVYRLGRAMELHARIWYRQYEFAKASAEVFSALEIFEGLGAAGDVESCMRLRGRIEQEEKRWSTSFRRSVLKTMMCSASVDSLLSAWHTIQRRGGDSSRKL